LLALTSIVAPKIFLIVFIEQIPNGAGGVRCGNGLVQYSPALCSELLATMTATAAEAAAAVPGCSPIALTATNGFLPAAAQLFARRIQY